MACIFDQTESCAVLDQFGKAVSPLVVEDEESVPSTEFGSDAASDSDSSEDDCDCGSASPFSVEDTILILDWDNTMLPTTWLEEQGLGLDEQSILSEEQVNLLEAMAEHARQTLHIAKTHGKVVLVTNAEHGWVELSCQKFMPRLLPSLQGVKILSARTTYERQGVAQPAEWKYLAFASEIDGFCELFGSERQKNIISIGDSPHERWALIRVAERIPNSRAKALKFMERPDLGQLVQEHQIISDCLSDIVRYDGSLDLCIERP
mmetsp:Transcript_21142/g.66122  ORF Transcript_21142/g.66122 Transcript_21142/m.66122 type:complete len:263 (+) Transcript_21142:100-888(+)